MTGDSAAAKVGDGLAKATGTTDFSSMYAGPGADLSVLEGPAGVEAHALLSRLGDLGLLGTNPGYPTKAGSGACRICGEDAPLTFEHIPPRASGNRTRAKGMSAYDMLDQDRAIDMPTSGWDSAQQGAGAYVLCKACNQNGRAGKHLVHEYAALATALTETLHSVAVQLKPGNVGLPAAVTPTLRGFALGRVARQAIAMLLGVSAGAAVTRLHPELRQLITGKDVPLPAGLRLGLALTPDTGRVRYAGPTAVMQPSGLSVYGEVSAPPCRWTLSWAGEHIVAPDGTMDVTDWLSMAMNDQVDVTVRLPIGMTLGAAPGDTRDEAAVRGTSAAAHEG